MSELPQPITPFFSSHLDSSDHRAALLENNEASAKLPLQMAERLFQIHPDSIANHATACSISD